MKAKNILIIILILVFILCMYINSVRILEKEEQLPSKEELELILNLEYDSCRTNEKIGNFTYEELYYGYTVNKKLYKETGKEYYLIILKYGYTELQK